MLRGLVKPPSTLVAFQPLARTDENLGEPALGQEDGILAFMVADGFADVTAVDKVVGTAELAAPTPVVAPVPPVAAVIILLETQELKLGLRAAFKS